MSHNEPTTTLAIELPSEVYRRLQQKAAEIDIAIGKLASEAIETWLASSDDVQDRRHKREQVRQKLRQAGLFRPLSEQLRNRIIPDVKHEEVESALARAGGKPLSEIIIEQRGPKL